MKNQKRSISILQVSGSLIWAALILICSFLLRDADESQMVVNTLIAGAGLQILVVGYFANKFLKNQNSV
jgi:hypothetical protein